MTMSSSAELADSQDLVEEILIRIPAKALLKFKCVCKQWLGLISDTRFCARHARLHSILNPTPSAILLDDLISSVDFQVIPLNSVPYAGQRLVLKDYLNLSGARLLQSCNGLLLCGSRWLVRPEDFVYLVSNPTTGQFKELFLYDLIYGKMLKLCELVGVCLAFDPEASPYYKIFLFFNQLDMRSGSCIVEIFIYSSETDSFTERKVEVDFKIRSDLFPGPNLTYCDNVVFCNGSIHWLRNDGSLSLVCFDIDTMVFKKMDFPQYTWHISHYFGESQGHLYSIIDRNLFSYKYEVVEIALDYSTLFVKYSVDLSFLASPLGGVDVGPLSLVYDKNTDKEILVVSAYAEHRLWGCHLPDEDFFKLPYSSIYYADRAYPYWESLACIH